MGGIVGKTCTAFKLTFSHMPYIISVVCVFHIVLDPLIDLDVSICHNHCDINVLFLQCYHTASQAFFLHIYTRIDARLVDLEK